MGWYTISVMKSLDQTFYEELLLLFDKLERDLTESLVSGQIDNLNDYGNFVGRIQQLRIIKDQTRNLHNRYFLEN